MNSRTVFFLALLSFVKALEVFGADATLPPQSIQLYLRAPMSYSVEPLTTSAGKGASATLLNAWRVEGAIGFLTAATTDLLTQNTIALASCDSSPSTDNVSPSAVVQSFSEKKPQAIILYSLNSARCDIKGLGDGDFQGYYTMVNMKPVILAGLKSLSINQTGIIAPQSTQQSTNPAMPQQTDQRTSSVAMSILYAVTGIIAALFVAIISTGAWRAHRNPERYGPLVAVAGRPRQSRAKGLARAMLETLPIVKFGDPVPSKGHDGDIELQGATAEGPHSSGADSASAREQKSEVQFSARAEGDHDDSATEVPDEGAAGREAESQPQGSNVGCSICTEDFLKGEDVRVLPCNHQYHPNCIDPWLLNVSGTCPLCRVDLRPVAEIESGADPAAEAGPASTPLPEAGRTSHSRVQRILAIRHASVHDRIATLRQLATEAGREQENNSPAQSPAEEERQRRRVSERLRRALHIRTRPASTLRVSRPAPQGTSARTQTPVRTGGADAASGTE